MRATTKHPDATNNRIKHYHTATMIGLMSRYSHRVGARYSKHDEALSKSVRLNKSFGR